jgi:hypothetical protein
MFSTLVLPIEDSDCTQIRVDETLKECQKGRGRIGRTKTPESDA